MPFRITGLDPAPFRHLYGRTEEELAGLGAQRMTCDHRPGFPDRVEMRDAEPGETLLLLNYVHQPARNPYHASHAIFVLEGSERRYDRVNEIPEVMQIRPISLRGFNAAHEMVWAELVDGAVLATHVGQMLGDETVAYLQAHYAVRGCYAGLIERCR